MLRSERTDNTSKVWLLSDVCRSSIQPTRLLCHSICQISRENVKKREQQQIQLTLLVVSPRVAAQWANLEILQNEVPPGILFV